jgi:hypothetical protein
MCGIGAQTEKRDWRLGASRTGITVSRYWTWLRPTKNMTNELRKEIKMWMRYFEKTQPKNLDTDIDSFEGGAYLLFQRVLAETSYYE